MDMDNDIMTRHGDSTTDKNTGFSWTYHIPLIKNSVLWRDLLLAFGIPVIFLGILLLFIMGGEDLLMIFMILGSVSAFLFFLIVIALIILKIIYGRGVETVFYFDDKGVGYESGRTSKKVGHGLAILGSLSGSPTAAGAGMLAASRDSGYMKWNEIGSVKLYNRGRVIYLRGKMLINPFALYCTRDNFDAVSEYVKKHATDAKIIEKR
ncbi:hypothetical protein [Methanooceanicella nereidis]|nr:hypothetical protein [Methanocella sp. CWC-04]